jgi:hypothetical protein
VYLNPIYPDSKTIIPYVANASASPGRDIRYVYILDEVARASVGIVVKKGCVDPSMG